jgi:hypothetical protein
MTSRRRGRALSLSAPLLSLVLLGLFCAPAWSLDLSDGRLKLTLHEGIGRFSLSFLTKGNEGIFVPLLASQDPRTTMLSVVVGNKVYRMGESSEFSETVEKIPGGGRFLWKSPFLLVTESFTFIASAESPVANGVRIDIGVKNVSEKNISAGIRYLFDTYLGEVGFAYFRTNTLSQVTRELTLTPSDKLLYWVSPLVGDPEDLGFQVMTAGVGITIPDRVVFANWKRLSDASWSYETSAARNFSQLPYSVNDSAASQYYDPRTIPPGTETTVTLAVGKFAREGFSITGPSPTQGFAQGMEQSLTTAKTTQDIGQAVRADLSTVNRILAEIDAALAAGTPVPDDKLSLMESALTELGGRSARYAPATSK